ncbi:MAG: hypothetical protein L0229_04880 [Blastocatellia bacterium]|nr:hypothetical protein [Blastocatellia bacterium]
MPIQITDYVNVAERAKELGCNVPTGIALLPRNFDTVASKDDLIHESSVADIRILWRQAELNETRIEKEGDKLPQAQEKSFEWVGPIIFVSALYFSQNPQGVSIALNIISNYLTGFFKGIPGNKKVRLDVVVEQTKSQKCLKVHYEGDVEGLAEVSKVIREAREIE